MKNKYLSLSYLVLSILIIMLVSGCGNGTDGEQIEAENNTEEITLTFSGGMPPDHLITKTMNYFAEEVGKQTDNQVSFEVYPAGQLYDNSQATNAVSTGTVDLAVLDASNLGGLSDAAAMSTMSFTMRDRETAIEIHEKFFDLVDKEFNEKGVKLIGWVPYGTDNGPLTIDKPIKTLEDFKGMKLRAVGEVSAQWLESAGANPINISSAEVYQALSNGTVEGAASGIGTYFSRKWYEQANYVVPTDLNYFMFMTTMNLNKWNSLSEEVQEALINVGREAMIYGADLVDDDKEEILNTFEEELEVYWLPDEEIERWAELMNPIYEEWANRSDATKEIMEYMLDNMD